MTAAPLRLEVTPMGSQVQTVAELDRLAAENARLREAIPVVTDGRFDGDSALEHLDYYKSEYLAED